MSTDATSRPRHALGMPAGSVRALLAFGILGYLFILILTVGEQGKTILNQKEASEAFIFLQLLMILILAHFFSAHGRTIGKAVSNRHPLGMPRGSIRFLLLGGYLGLLYYVYHEQIQFQFPERTDLTLFLGVILVAFIIGHAITGMITRATGGWLPAWFQDVQAWFALIGLVLLGIIVLVRLVINTSLPLEQQVGLAKMEVGMAGMVSFYFGARS